jgi:hypothetical protein
MVVLGTMSLMMSVAAANYKVLDDPMDNATSQMTGFIKQVRARAISSTTAYRLELVGDNTIVAKTSASCSDAAEDFATDSKLALTIEKDVRISSGLIDICFSPRGLANWNWWITITERQDPLEWRNLEITLGGTVMVHDS